MAKRQCLLYIAAASILLFAAVFTLFTFTRPECYPKKVMKMSSTDMRLASSVSSLWCEALEVSSDHPFLAFRLSKEPSISPTSLSRNEVDLKLRLKLSAMRHVQYFLLPGTLMTVAMCSTHHGATIYVRKGRDIQNYKQESVVFAPDENDAGSSEERNHYSEEDDDSNEDKHTVIPITGSKFLKSQEIPVSNIDDVDCELTTSNKLFQHNITISDTYVMVVHHKGPALRNFVKIRLFLDRTFYNIEKDVRSVHVCSGGLFTSSCAVPLDFLSKDRVLIKIPGEPGAGLTTFKVRSSCKPRFSLVTVISLTVPLVLFTFSLLFAIYMKQSGIESRLNKRRQNTSACALLKSNADGGCGIDNDEEKVLFQMGKPGEGTIKEVGLHIEFPDAVPCHGDQAAKEISDDQPPSYKSVEFTPEGTAK